MKSHKTKKEFKQMAHEIIRFSWIRNLDPISRETELPAELWYPNSAYVFIYSIRLMYECIRTSKHLMSGQIVEKNKRRQHAPPGHDASTRPRPLPANTRQSRERRAGRGTNSERHTEWWTSSRASSFTAYETAFEARNATPHGSSNFIFISHF